METKNPTDISTALKALETSAICLSSLIILRWSGYGIAVYKWRITISSDKNKNNEGKKEKAQAYESLNALFSCLKYFII